MRALIAGGGIGGIAAAIALRKAGMHPLVLEQARQITAVGAGIAVSPNVMKALAYLGCADAIRSVSMIGNEMLFQDLETGARLFSCKLSGTDAYARFGESYYHIHRADLLDTLLSLLPLEFIRTNARVVAVDQTADHVCVRLEDGEEIQGDVLIGADGLKSTVRASLFGQQDTRFSGLLAWRAVFPVETAPQVPVVANAAIWLGPERYITFYPVRSGELFNFVGFVPATEVHRESWTVSGDVHELRKSFDGACEAVRMIVESIQEAFLSAIVFRDPLKCWSVGRITLLGDAAHPAPPTAGQGAAMAIEDAVTLAECLRRSTPSGLPNALREYELRRRPRTTRVLTSARSNDRFMRESDPVQVRARNGRFRGLQQLDPYGEVMWRWIYAFDPIAALHQPIDVAMPASMGTLNALKRAQAQRAFDLWRGALGPEDHAGGWRGQRAGYERFFEQSFRSQAAVEILHVATGQRQAIRVRPSTRSGGPTVLYLHGGGFVLGSAQSSVGIAARLAAAVAGEALIVDYRLAPEHPFPCALNDALDAYHGLLSELKDARQIIVCGEDAGGGLALSLALTLKQKGTPMPSLLQFISPLCDLSLKSESIDSNVDSEAWWNRDLLTFFAASYVQDADLATHTLSPLLGDFSGLPAMLVHVAREEALRDDALRLVERAQRAGVDVTLHAVEDSVHSFPLFGFLPEAEAAAEHLASLATQLCRGVTG